MKVKAEKSTLGRVQLLDLEVDLELQQVWRDGQLLDLAKLSFSLLAVLIQNAPNTINKDELIRETWGNIVVSDETLSQRVRLLRLALGEDGQEPRYLASVRGQGYRLICPVLQNNPRGKNLLSQNPLIVFASLIFLGSLLTWLFLTNQEDPLNQENPYSIAVLPFSDLSADQSQQYFADGIQEELLSRIAGVAGLEVASRTSVEPYRITSLGLPEIANRIGVRYIMEGSVRFADNRVRVTIQLIEASKDRHLWAENYDRELSVENIFSIQDEIAVLVAETLRVNFPQSATTQKLSLPTDNLEAYNAYLLGRYYLYRSTSESLAQAEIFLTRAIALDSSFAEAHASLGSTYSFMGTNYGGRPPAEVYPQAKQATLRALALDGELAAAHSIYADILTWFDWNFDVAEQEYKRTLALDPNNTLGYALFLATQNRTSEAIELIDQKLLTAPNDPWVHANAGWRYLDDGQYERAISEALLTEGHQDTNAIIGFSLLESGQTESAISSFEKDLKENNRGPTQLSNLAVAYHKGARSEEADVLLNEIIQIDSESYVSPALIAAIYFAAGDSDTGFALLQKAYTQKAREMAFLQFTGMLDGYRNDLRYKELIQAVGF